MVSVTGMTVAEIERRLDDMVVEVYVDGGHVFYKRRNDDVIDGGELVASDLANAAAYPIGSIYTSVSPANPGDPGVLGIGTWVRFGQGQVLVGQSDIDTEFNTPEASGGEKTHTLTTAEIPSHQHVMSHDHTISISSAGSHNHDIAVRYAGNFSENESGDAITGVGGANHGSTTSGGTDTGATSTDGAHTHAADVGAFSGSTVAAGGGGAHNNLQPYVVVYIWKRTA
jgi:microcystin-dependent protein